MRIVDGASQNVNGRFEAKERVGFRERAARPLICVRLYKNLPFRYNAGMMPDLKTTCGGEHACAQHRLVAFLNRFSGL